MDFWVVLGAVGSVASLIGVALPLETKRQRLIHVVYGISIAILASTAVWYWQENQRVRNIELAATRLLQNSGFDYTTEGFIQAALAFLEKNKDLYPDSYARAQEICKLSNCTSPQYSEGKNPLDHGYNQIQAKSSLEGLVRGISKLEGP